MKYPLTRLRRTRSHVAIRSLNSETTLLPKDLIQPIFITDAEKQKEAIATLPNVYRLGEKDLLELAEQCCACGVNAIALFPNIPTHRKSEKGEEAYNPSGLVQRRVQILRKNFPELAIICDVALDPYTTHGHDGILTSAGVIDNDATIEVLIKQSLSLVHAGAQIIAPSDMMDGRIGAIRAALEREGHSDILILSYAAKYASSLYGPFRDASGSNTQLRGASKKTYQMNFANRREALLEARLDIEEGADMIMVKPALPYLDIIADLSKEFETPIYAYQVSGEYAMIAFGAQAGAFTIHDMLVETLTSIKRAGARAIISYGALTIAQLLSK
ncbi:MAG: porphobilinogen synthase [Methylacidiphilales bacterium]|nr:porphobilinogen synthase [Candidatus Methylacidiphilales bacterium]